MEYSEISNYSAFGIIALLSTLYLRNKISHISYKNKQSASVAERELSNSKRIFKFVLTGGPCAGKTTALERLQGFLKERGLKQKII